ncbi:MAG: Holliday junction branch migration DNA helicase RuvB [Candidatus Eisenbacteria bacterium]|nr:Holliday junction branch migration DNA helicase RuvB [Candidatus Eisenbacteria bacterium]
MSDKPRRITGERPGRLADPAPLPEDAREEKRLRPSALSEFVGQPQIREPLAIFLEAARRRGEALDHVLFHGPPGLGKTTLASILAHELGVEITHTSGPVIEKAGDLAGLLTNLGPRGILFVDEIHRLSPIVEEYLYSALEDFTLDVLIDRGPSARSLKLNLEPFTLVGATTRSGLLSAPMRARFGVTLRMDFYAVEDLRHIVRRSAGILETVVDDDAAREIARRSRGTPRVANRLLRRVRDFALIKSDGRVELGVTREALRLLEVDERGLDEMDRRMLEALIQRYDGGPVGLQSLAVVLGEDAGTLEDVYEPFLVQEGFVRRTARGREATRLAYEHLSVPLPARLRDGESRTDQPELPLA